MAILLFKFNFTIANFDSQQDHEDCGSTLRFGSHSTDASGMYGTTPNMLMLS